MTSSHADIHADLRSSVRSYAERTGGTARVRRLREDATGFDRDAWRACAELGWCGVLVPEGQGGAGLGLAEMAVIARESGRALLPEPLVELAVLAAGILRRSEQRARWLAPLVRGELVAAVAWQEHLGGLDPGVVATEVVQGRSGLHIKGLKRFVAHGLAADGFVVSARTAHGVGLYWVARDQSGVGYRSLPRADGSEHGELSLDHVEIGPGALIVAPEWGLQVLAEALDEAVLMSAAELLGVGERALKITLEYLRTRVQFGKAIGSFQALQHRCVDLHIQKELGAAALESAIAAWPAADQRARSALASRVKARCADAALDICRKAIQMHGAIGFTDECDIGLYLKRALTLCAWLGNAQMHRRRYAALILTSLRHAA